MVRAICLTAAVLCVAGLAGCGDGGRLSKTEYEQKVQSVYGEVREAFVRTNVTDPRELVERVEDAQDELRDAAEELEGVQPPEDVEAENAQIARGFRAYAEDLDRLRNAAEQGDERTIEDFNARIGRRESVAQIAEAAESIKFKGYDIGLIAEE